MELQQQRLQLLGLKCEIFMGKEDTDRQALNVYRMELLEPK